MPADSLGGVAHVADDKRVEGRPLPAQRLDPLLSLRHGGRDDGYRPRWSAALALPQLHVTHRKDESVPVAARLRHRSQRAAAVQTLDEGVQVELLVALGDLAAHALAPRAIMQLPPAELGRPAHHDVRGRVQVHDAEGAFLQSLRHPCPAPGTPSAGWPGWRRPGT